MDYFSVFYHGIADVLQEEEQIYKIIDEQCSEIFQIMNSVGLQPTLQGHGYVKKLWSAYGKTSTIVTQINRMRTGLMKVVRQKLLRQYREVNMRNSKDWILRKRMSGKMPFMREQLVLGKKIGLPPKDS